MLSRPKNDKKEKSLAEVMEDLSSESNYTSDEVTGYFLKIRALSKNARAQLEESLTKSLPGWFMTDHRNRTNLEMVKAILLNKAFPVGDFLYELSQNASSIKQRIKIVVVMHGEEEAKKIFSNMLISVLKSEEPVDSKVLSFLSSLVDSYTAFMQIFSRVRGYELNKLIKASSSNDFFFHLIKMSYGDQIATANYHAGSEAYKNYVDALMVAYEKYKMNPSWPLLNEEESQKILFLNALFYVLDHAGTDKEKRKVFESYLIDRNKVKLLEVELFKKYLVSLKASNEGRENVALAKQLEDAYLCAIKQMEKHYEGSVSGSAYKEISKLLRKAYKQLLFGGAEKMIAEQGDYNDAIKLLTSACKKPIITDDKKFAGLHKPSVALFENKIQEIVDKQKAVMVPSRAVKKEGSVFVFWDKPVSIGEKAKSQALVPVEQTITKAISLPSTSNVAQVQVTVAPAAQTSVKAVSLPPIESTPFWKRENPVKTSLIEFLKSSNTAALLKSFNHYDEHISLSSSSNNDDSKNVSLLLAACAAICFESSDRLQYRQCLRSSDSELGQFLNCLFDEEYNIDLLKLQDKYGHLHPIQLIFLGIEVACQSQQPTIFFIDQEKILSILNDTRTAMTMLFKDCGSNQDKAAAKVSELKEDAAKLAREMKQEKPKSRVLAS